MLVPLARDDLLARREAIIGRRAARHEGLRLIFVQGKGSDRQYGRAWFAEKTRKRGSAAGAEPAPAAGAINIGVVYHGPVASAPVAQTFNNAASSGPTKVRCNSPVLYYKS